jgi:hypothetical protein
MQIVYQQEIGAPGKQRRKDTALVRNTSPVRYGPG